MLQGADEAVDDSLLSDFAGWQDSDQCYRELLVIHCLFSQDDETMMSVTRS